MIIKPHAKYSLNILLHIFLLFIFLTFFFFIFASKLEKNNINNYIGNIIDKNVSQILYNWKTKSSKNINWEEIKKAATNIYNNSENQISLIQNNNKKLLFTSFTIIIILFFILICLYSYYTFIKGYNINIKHILLENVIIFILICVVEIIFFKFFISKYTSISPNYIVKTVLQKNI